MLKRVATCMIMTLAAVLMVGCGAKEKNICHVNPNNWNNSAEIIYDNQQPNTILDISFFVRCNTDFDLDMMSVVISTESPNKEICIEPTTWLFDAEKAPNPTSTIQKIGYRSTCILNQVGEYKFSITPISAIKGVEAVGIVIENLQ